MPHSRITIDADLTPDFTASYLRIADGECAFIEAHTPNSVPRLLSALQAHGRRPEDVRYIVVTHAHLDHASGASALMTACPNAQLLAHPRTGKHLAAPKKLIEAATQVYGEARFRALYGTFDAIPISRMRLLEDGATFDLGGARLAAFHTYGHAFHHMVVDDAAADTVYTGDTFGLVFPALQSRGLFALPSTSPTGFDANEARKSLDKVLSLKRGSVCPTHFGAHLRVSQIGAQVRRFLDRAESWVLSAAESDEPLERLHPRFVGAWWAAIRGEAPGFGESELSLLAPDVDLNAAGLVHAVAERRRTGRS